MADPKETEAQDQGTPDPGAAPRGTEPKPTGPADAPAATQGESVKAPRGKEKKAKKPAEGERAASREPAGPPPPPPPPAEPAPRPRLLDFYEQRVRAKLAQQFGFGNPHAIPRLVKIVVNLAVGGAPTKPQRVEGAGPG